MEDTHEVWVNSITRQVQVCYKGGMKPSGDGWSKEYSGSFTEANCFANGVRFANKMIDKMINQEAEVEKSEQPQAFFIHREGQGFICGQSGNMPKRFGSLETVLDYAKNKAISEPNHRFLIMAPVAAVIVNLPEPELTIFIS